MGNKRGGVDGVGNDRGGVDGVGNDRGSMNGVGNDGGRVDGVGNRDSLRVLGLARVGDLSDVAVNVVGVVGDGLDTAVREVHLVGALNNTGAIVALRLAEGGLGVVVGNSVVVGVGGDLSKVIKRGSVCNSVHDRGVVDDRGSVDDRGVVDNGGGMDKRGGVESVVGNRVGESRGGMDKRGGVGHSVVGNGVGNYWSSMGNWVGNVGSDGNNSSVSDGNRPVGSNGRLDLREALGVVGLGNGRVGGAKGLGLDKSPLLAMSSGD